MSVCNRDCFNCPYPDCILEELEADDYAEQRRIEREIINPKSKRQEKLAAKNRAYYEANREKLRAYQREYQKEYRRRKKEQANVDV